MQRHMPTTDVYEARKKSRQLQKFKRKLFFRQNQITRRKKAPKSAERSELINSITQKKRTRGQIKVT